MAYTNTAKRGEAGRRRRARNSMNPRPRGVKWDATNEDPTGTWGSHSSRTNRKSGTKARG